MCELALFVFSRLHTIQKLFHLLTESVLVSGKSSVFFPFPSLHSSEGQNGTQMWLYAPKSANSFKVQQMYQSNEDKMYSKIKTLRTFVIKSILIITPSDNSNSIIQQRGSHRKALEFITCTFDPCRARFLARSPVSVGNRQPHTACVPGKQSNNSNTI